MSLHQRPKEAYLLTPKLLYSALRKPIALRGVAYAITPTSPSAEADAQTTIRTPPIAENAVML
jgi:hypothetical protein